MNQPGHDLAESIVARAERMSIEARLVLALGCIQRCDAFYRRSIDDFPGRSRYGPVVARGLELAWARVANERVEQVEVEEVAAELRSFAPEDPDDPALDGDASWSTMTYRGLADALHRRAGRDAGAYASAMMSAPRNLIFTWYQWAELDAGREAGVAQQTSTSAYLLELAVQTRHIEWLRFRPVDTDLIRRIRADSIRAGAELVAIVDEWRSGQ